MLNGDVALGRTDEEEDFSGAFFVIIVMAAG